MTLSTRRDKICWLVWRAISMKTFLPNAENRKRGWFVIDADGIVLGRLATRVASLLRGKHKAEFTPHIDTGDGVIVVNAAKVRLTGRKAQRDFIDASDVVLGRLASHVATLLRGKHKPIFAPHIDTGDFVVVVNADKVALSGSKLQDKRAYRHSGYPGGIHSVTYSELLAKHPERVVEKAVKGMLPKNSLGRTLIKHLRVYRGAEHPHFAQKPEKLEVGR